MTNPIAAARKQSGLTLAQLAVLVNVESTRRGWGRKVYWGRLGDYEHGRRYPGAEVAQLIVDVLGMDMTAVELIRRLKDSNQPAHPVGQ